MISLQKWIEDEKELTKSKVDKFFSEKVVYGKIFQPFDLRSVALKSMFEAEPPEIYKNHFSYESV